MRALHQYDRGVQVKAIRELDAAVLTRLSFISGIPLRGGLNLKFWGSRG